MVIEMLPAREAEEVRRSAAGVDVAVDRLSVRVGRRFLLQDVSVSFAPQRITAIAGASGAGKTTLLRAINRMHDHTPGMSVEGSIRIGGHEIYGRATDLRSVRRGMGMVFQRPKSFPLVDPHDVAAIVRRRLAGALALWPSVMLLDDPTSGLDAETTEHIEQQIVRLRERMTILIATTDPAQARRVSDEIVFLDAGRVRGR